MPLRNANHKFLEQLNAKHSKEDTDNFMSLPLHSPLHQQVAVVGDDISFVKAAQQVVERNKSKPDWDEPFLIGDIGALLKQHKRWKLELPRVEAFYAVKANALRPVVGTLAALGLGFDCASKNELALILGAGVNPDKVIYAHTCKIVSHLCYARDHGVKMMTFDNEEELHKVKKYCPDARLVLRIKTVDKKARTLFGNKFGASMEDAKLLIKKANFLHLDVIGISFHVGSSCPDPNTFRTAIENSRILFDFSSDFGFEFKLLDIGGGFPGSGEEESHVSYISMTEIIRDALDTHFPVESGVRIIAEPGRYFPGPAFGLATCVHAKKSMKDRVSYYVPDSMCNSFLTVFFENAQMNPIPLKPAQGEKRPTTVYGVTCTGSDIVAKDTRMEEVNVGDWIYWNDIGGYSAMTKIGFNGFTTYKACYFIAKSKWEELQDTCEFSHFLPPTRFTI